jgi:hypothetical protein
VTNHLQAPRRQQGGRGKNKKNFLHGEFMPSDLEFILAHSYQQAGLSISSLWENFSKTRTILTQNARNDGIISAALN